MSLGPRLLLLLGTVAAIVLVGEGVARLSAFVEEVRTAAPETPAVPGAPELRDVLDLARPNVQGVFQGVPYRTNSRGLRGPDYGPRPEPGSFRILIAGDSVTMGWGVAEEQAYPKRLEGLLNDAAGDLPGAGAEGAARRFEVVNLGLAGVNAAFSSNRLRIFSDEYQPDLLVYGFTLNDIEGPHYRKLDRKSRKSLNQALWRRALRFEDSPSYLLRWLWPRWILLLEWDAFHPSESERIAPMAEELRQNYFENPEAWADFLSALDVQAEVAAAHGLCGHVFLHTHLTELVPEHRYLPIYERVAEAARARGLTVTRSFEDFVGRDGEALWVNAFDVHPNAAGHEILAHSLFRGLRALPARCFRTAAERQAAAAYSGGAASPSAGASAAEPFASGDAAGALPRDSSR